MCYAVITYATFSVARHLIKLIARLFAILLIIIAAMGGAYCQNLLIDGGFEELRDSDCQNPDQSFDRLKHWYALNATPDLFNGSCQYDATEFIFWDRESTPYEGSTFAGIWARWNSNETYFVEGVATRFVEPLEAGKTYFFEMAVRNRGGFQGLEESVSGCSLRPDKHVDIYLSADSIIVTNNFSNGTAATTADLVATLDSETIQGGESDEWSIVSTCFEAIGGETYFALIMPLGTFGTLPTCAAMSTSGVFRSFYYQIDAASLTELPESFETEVVACQDRDLEVNLVDQLSIDIIEKAELLWDDGYIGAERTIMELRDYMITAQLNCESSIPIQFRIITEDCSTLYYIPNSFSPNNDGQNDQFKVTLSENASVSRFEFRVFDRWGSEIFYSADPSIGWNGLNKNSNSINGVYSWSLVLEFVEANELKTTFEGGTVLLVN